MHTPIIYRNVSRMEILSKKWLTELLQKNEPLYCSVIHENKHINLQKLI